MADVADKLREARALIERGWCQKVYALGKSGNEVDYLGRAAVCFCAIGAVHKVGGGDDEFAALQEVIGTRYIAAWNDRPSRTQTEVLAAFDKAIELAEADNG